MNPLLLPWAAALASLGWLYSALAASWPRLFNRDTIHHAIRQSDGYRLGRLIYWQLPGRAAVLFALLSALPLLALTSLPGGVAVGFLVIATLAILALWLAHSPGQRMEIAEISRAGQGTIFELRPAGGLLRSIAVLFVFGIVPAGAVGLIVFAVRRAADQLA